MPITRVGFPFTRLAKCFSSGRRAFKDDGWRTRRGFGADSRNKPTNDCHSEGEREREREREQGETEKEREERESEPANMRRRQREERGRNRRERGKRNRRETEKDGNKGACR